MKDPSVISVVREVGGIFELIGVPFVITGSVASVQFGETRSTNDVGFVADLAPHKVKPFVNQFGDDWYVDEEMIRDAISHDSSFNLISMNSFMKADVYILTDDPFGLEVMKRKIQVTLGTGEDCIQTYIATKEDSLLQKLRWFRLGNEFSERQWRDVIGLLLHQQGNFDEVYVSEWAEKLGVTDLLIKAKQQAGV